VPADPYFVLTSNGLYIKCMYKFKLLKEVGLLLRLS